MSSSKSSGSACPRTGKRLKSGESSVEKKETRDCRVQRKKVRVFEVHDGPKLATSPLPVSYTEAYESVAALERSLRSRVTKKRAKWKSTVAKNGFGRVRTGGLLGEMFTECKREMITTTPRNHFPL
jgi:hypothetical protein